MLHTFGIRLFRSKHFAHKSTSLQVEWFCPLQGATSHGTINLCLSCGGAPFIQRPKEQEWEQNRFASVKPLQLIAGQKNWMNPAGPKTTKRLYLKRCFIVLLMIQHIYSSKYLYWTLQLYNLNLHVKVQQLSGNILDTDQAKTPLFQQGLPGDIESYTVFWTVSVIFPMLMYIKIYIKQQNSYAHMW